MFKRIGTKLILLVGVTAVTSIALFAYLSLRSMNSGMLAEVERHASQLSETVRASTRYEMLLNERDHIRRIVQGIGQQPGIGKVRIMNKAGEIIYSSVEADIGTMVDKDAESCYSCHSADRPLERLPMKERTRIFQVHPDSSRYLGIITPIQNEPSCWTAECHAHPQDKTVLGVLDVALPLREADRTLSGIQLELLLSALAAFLAISLIMALFVRRWVDKPVKELVRATQAVADGNLNYTIKERRQDELGVLAASFNNMTRKLADARVQLFQSDKLASLGRLAAGVAHEINNPLTGVLTYSSFLMRRTQDRPEIQEDLKVVVRETIRCREIVKSLLDFARQSVPKKTEASLNEIIDRAIHVAGNQLTAHHIKLVRNTAEDLPKITVDANQIQQVFLNLIVNAADAIGPQGGTITIGSSLLQLSPRGITQVRKAQCPKRHSLINDEVRIGGLPSIRVRAIAGTDQGLAYLDPVYGRHNHQFGLSAPAGTELQLSCPECQTSLLEPAAKCPVCSARVCVIEVPGQGRLEICARRGCQWVQWGAVDAGGLSDYVEITVADTGSGIAAEDLPRIFEPFYTTKGQKGTGLGLSVIWGIVDNHNGTISVDSRPSEGTTFSIRIPVRQPR
ncbi:MAG: integral rane sensor signal transduction histidine kinase [Bacteroidetes bacterium]|nr:integral rane sensor signal transduction histidine kinase [Bacteroidota bacterium]